MTFWVYILHCNDGSYYTGHTDNLKTRIAQHNYGQSDNYTKIRRPVKLVFSQECSTRDEALNAEFRIKGWNRKKKEAMIKNDWDEVKRLARGKNKNERCICEP